MKRWWDIRLFLFFGLKKLAYPNPPNPPTITEMISEGIAFDSKRLKPFPICWTINPSNNVS
jgi:hypothetical protein